MPSQQLAHNYTNHCVAFKLHTEERKKKWSEKKSSQALSLSAQAPQRIQRKFGLRILRKRERIIHGPATTSNKNMFASFDCSLLWRWHCLWFRGCCSSFQQLKHTNDNYRNNTNINIKTFIFPMVTSYRKIQPNWTHTHTHIRQIIEFTDRITTTTSQIIITTTTKFDKYIVGTQPTQILSQIFISIFKVVYKSTSFYLSTFCSRLLLYFAINVDVCLSLFSLYYINNTHIKFQFVVANTIACFLFGCSTPIHELLLRFRFYFAFWFFISILPLFTSYCWFFHL